MHCQSYTAYRAQKPKTYADDTISGYVAVVGEYVEAWTGPSRVALGKVWWPELVVTVDYVRARVSTGQKVS